MIASRKPSKVLNHDAHIHPVEGDCHVVGVEARSVSGGLMFLNPLRDGIIKGLNEAGPCPFQPLIHWCRFNNGAKDRPLFVADPH